MLGACGHVGNLILPCSSVVFCQQPSVWGSLRLSLHLTYTVASWELE